MRRLGVTPPTVRKGIREGRIPGGVQITAHCYRVLRVPFEHWLRTANQQRAPIPFLHRREAR